MIVISVVDVTSVVSQHKVRVVTVMRIKKGLVLEDDRTRSILLAFKVKYHNVL